MSTKKMLTMSTLLEVKNLETAFDIDGTDFNAVDSVSFKVKAAANCRNCWRVWLR